MIKRNIVLSTILFLFVYSSLAWAIAQIPNGSTVTGVDVRDGGQFLVTFSANNTQGGCGSATPNRLSGDSSTPGGKSILSAALSAYLSGKPVFAQGTGLCSQFQGIESLALLQLW